MSAPEVELIADYPAAVAAIVAELSGLGPGDEARLELYLLEPGASSQAVLDGLGAAAGRGARVQVALDASAASALSRLVERTGTLRPALRALARAHPGRIELLARAGTDHAKVLRFLRPRGVSCALFGGMNLGDRFATWRDFMVRVRGEALLAELDAARAGRLPRPAIDPEGPPLAFVANAPAAGVFQVREVLQALCADPRWARLQVAMAYLDRTGAALLAQALARGAEVELVLPRDANVYPHANRRALAGLMRGPHAARLTARWVPGMLHAKALLGRGADGARLGLLGSANLKRNSLDRFGELDALVRAPSVLDALQAALDGIVAASHTVREPPTWGRARAWIEEQLG